MGVFWPWRATGHSHCVAFPRVHIVPSLFCSSEPLGVTPRVKLLVNRVGVTEFDRCVLEVRACERTSAPQDFPGFGNPVSCRTTMTIDKTSASAFPKRMASQATTEKIRNRPTDSSQTSLPQPPRGFQSGQCLRLSSAAFSTLPI